LARTKKGDKTVGEALASPSVLDVATIPGARHLPIFPQTFNPMLAALPEGPLGRPGAWIFEPKLDGIRCIAMVRNGVAKLLSRRGLDLTFQYPGLAEELPKLLKGDCIVDGEIIALNAAGRPSFQHLQQRMNLTREADVQRAEKAVPAHFFVFDIVRAGEYDLTGVKLSLRKQVLEQVLTPSDRVHMTPRFDCEGTLAYEVCVENGFEGIVAKRLESLYECGRRSPYWTKVKAQQTGEFVIGGYSPGEGSRTSTFGSLLLGYFNAEKKFVYCGSVGTGFDDKLLHETLRRLKPHITEKCPFVAVPSDKRRSTWVTPVVVAEIKYMDMTRDGHLRTPVFMHFREDKVAPEIQHPETQRVIINYAEVAPAAIPVVAEAVSTVYDKVVGQLSGNEVAMELLIGEEKLALSSLTKELWPKNGDHPAFTKRDYLRCLTQMAPYLLPHWQGRPVTMIRSPLGVKGKFFYQKHWHSAFPEFIDTYQFEEDGEVKEYLLCNNLASLLFFAQHYCLEFHTFASRMTMQPDPIANASADAAELLEHPDYIIFDLDFHAQSNKKAAELDLEAFKRTRDVGYLLHEYLRSAKLNSFVKLSGRNGLHVFVPVKREFDFGGTRTLAETIARFLVQQKPQDVSVEFEVKKRAGKVYVDCGSNGSGKTIAATYTPRAVPWAAVSAPVKWEELATITPSDLTLYTIASRLRSVGDIWVDILSKKNDLSAALSKRNTK
jgi:bifunctional non-homologous end joining protein LigD